MDYITRQEFEAFKSSMTQQSHDGYDGNRVNLIDLIGFIPTITDATELTRTTTVADRVPSTIYGQLFIDTTTATKKLYIYDVVGKVWRSVTIA